MKDKDEGVINEVHCWTNRCGEGPRDTVIGTFRRTASPGERALPVRRKYPQQIWRILPIKRRRLKQATHRALRWGWYQEATARAGVGWMAFPLHRDRFPPYSRVQAPAQVRGECWPQMRMLRVHTTHPLLTKLQGLL